MFKSKLTISERAKKKPSKKMFINNIDFIFVELISVCSF